MSAYPSPPNSWVHTWLLPLFTWLVGLKDLVNTFISGQPGLEVDVAATAALSACVYANGTLGVGATLTGSVNGAMDTVDGVAPALNKTYLLCGQAAGLQNGPYKLTVVGDGSTKFVLTRMVAYDQSAEMKDGTLFGIRAGTINANTTFKQTSADGPTVGTDALTFVRDPLVVTTNSAQTISAAKKFVTLMLNVWNAGATFVTKFASNATADRTATFPDVDLTVAQAAVATAAATPTHAGTASFQAPVAPETTAGACTIVADVVITAVALTLLIDPPNPVKLNLIKTDGDSSYAALVTIIGVGPGGEALNEVVTMLAVDGTHTYVTANAYAKITSATVSALSGNTGADKIAIGQSAALGLPIPSGAASVVVYKAAKAATGSAVNVDEAVGTVDATARTIIPTTAPDGTKCFRFHFKYTVSHTHVQT